MVSKRLQGIAFTTIVTGAIALIVLFILGYLLVMWLGGFGRTLPGEIDNFKKSCRSYCSEVKQLASQNDFYAVTLQDLKQSSLCKKFVSAERYGGYKRDHCYDDFLVKYGGHVMNRTSAGLAVKKDFVQVPCDVNVLIKVPGAGGGTDVYVCSLENACLLALACLASDDNEFFSYTYHLCGVHTEDLCEPLE